MKKRVVLFLFCCITTFIAKAQPAVQHDLHFTSLPAKWDEGVPLGNGLMGALVWQKENNIRFSLDRADLWDLRPTKDLQREEFNYKFVQEQVKKKDLTLVRKYFESPYRNAPAPSKIPGAALEFGIQNWGKVLSVNLSLKDALCEVKWDQGIVLKTFIHATQPVGWFRIENLKSEFVPHLIAPKYQGNIKATGNTVGGDDLAGLAYKQGSVVEKDHLIIYDQEGWGGFKYQVSVKWKKIDSSTIEGVWSISSQYPAKKVNPLAVNVVTRHIQNGYAVDFRSHLAWWEKFWHQSAITVPDVLLEKQWYLEQYKFGSAARKGAPPISLQAVWTADNGR
ncbi:MAG TPA: hypothetical protein VL088_04260, partial [Pedobacter sp.]|nr:hypothetical protein [Pedobacter sp.]